MRNNSKVSTVIAQDLKAKMQAARETLDAHVQETVAWHFDPKTGSPFWLEFASKLDWDPRKEVRIYDDLDRFGGFEDEWLRGGPVRRWVPKGLSDKPVFVFETEAAPEYEVPINISDFRTDYEIFSESPRRILPRVLTG